MMYNFVDLFWFTINWFTFHTRNKNRKNISILSIFPHMRSLYVIQPYEVGSKKAKSLALVIPAKVVKKYNITISTVFVLKANTQTKTIVLEQTIYPVNIEPQGI